MSRVIALFVLAASTGCDKGSDSAGEGDADTDTDTDTDTDVDEVRYLDGTIHVVVTDATGKTTKCDTMIDITGVESSGGCINCDFELDTEATVASEKGVDCDPALYPLSTLIEGGLYSDIWVGWADEFVGTYDTYTDIVWFGFGLTGNPGPYWYSALAYDGKNSSASYSGGLLDWSRQAQYIGNNLLADYTCGAQVYMGTYSADPDYYGVGSPNFYGNYTAYGSLDCSYNKPYDRWSFYGVDDTYASVSVDTISADSSFDPMFYVTTDDYCIEALGDENFDCTYPGTSGFLCPSVRFPTTKGEHYNLWVLPFRNLGFGDCDNKTADYQLWIDTKGDPSLTKATGGELFPPGDIVTAEATSTITIKKEPN